MFYINQEVVGIMATSVPDKVFAFVEMHENCEKITITPVHSVSQVQMAEPHTVSEYTLDPSLLPSFLLYTISTFASLPHLPLTVFAPHSPNIPTLLSCRRTSQCRSGKSERKSRKCVDTRRPSRRKRKSFKCSRRESTNSTPRSPPCRPRRNRARVSPWDLLRPRSTDRVNQQHR